MIRKYYEYEGLGGGIDPKSTSKAQPMTQTMTKEQILEKHSTKLTDGTCICSKTSRLRAMQEYAQQEVAKEREKAGKLIGALNEYIVILGEELDEVMGFVNAHQWKSTRFEQGKILREKIKQSLTEYGQPNSL